MRRADVLPSAAAGEQQHALEDGPSSTRYDGPTTQRRYSARMVAASSVVDQLRALALSGMSLRRAGAQLGMRGVAAYRLVPDLRVRPRLSDAVRQRVVALLREGQLPYSRIALAAGCSKTSVLRIRDRLDCDQGADEVEFRRTRSAYRCPCCQRLIQISPCAACASTGGRASA